MLNIMDGKLLLNKDPILIIKIKFEPRSGSWHLLVFHWIPFIIIHEFDLLLLRIIIVQDRHGSHHTSLKKKVKKKVKIKELIMKFMRNLSCTLPPVIAWEIWMGTLQWKAGGNPDEQEAAVQPEVGPTSTPWPRPQRRGLGSGTSWFSRHQSHLLIRIFKKLGGGGEGFAPYCVDPVGQVAMKNLFTVRMDRLRLVRYW